MFAPQLPHVSGAFPVFDSLSPTGFELLARQSSLAQLTTGQAIARPGDACHQIAFMIGGEVRVHQTSETGRDLTLYRIYPGQTCVLTAMSILANQAFPAHADVTEDCEALVVPRAAFRQLFETEDPWRRFVFQVVSDRLADLFALIDTVIFADLPSSLADALLTQQEAGIVHLTHEQIAAEIGCSREAVSRLLKGWERDGIVRLGRGQVAVTSTKDLMRMTMPRRRSAVPPAARFAGP